MSNKHVALIVAVILLAAIPFILQAVLAAFQRQQEIARTEATMVQIANELDKNVGPDGKYVRVGPYLETADAWGTQLKVTYHREHAHSPHEYLVLRSEGPDCMPGTGDDLTLRRDNLIGQNVVREPARGAVHGIADGIRDLINSNSNDDQDNDND